MILHHLALISVRTAAKRNGKRKVEISLPGFACMESPAALILTNFVLPFFQRARSGQAFRLLLVATCFCWLGRFADGLLGSLQLAEPHHLCLPLCFSK